MGSSVSSGYVLGCRKEYIVFGLIAPLMQLLSYIRGLSIMQFCWFSSQIKKCLSYEYVILLLNAYQLGSAGRKCSALAPLYV